MYNKEDFKCPIIVLSWLQIQGIIKCKMVVFTRDNARLHTVIVKGYNDVSIIDDPQLKAYVFVVNQEQAFELVFKWGLNVDEAKPNSMWLV